MATAEQQKAFIEKIGPLVQEIGPHYGLVCPSAIIAQACLESAYGTSHKARYNNFFGLKYRKGRVSCSSGTVTDVSKEERAGGKVVSILDSWYSFGSMADGVRGYCQFLDIQNYGNLKGVRDPEEYLTNIRMDGYATSSAYVSNVMGVIRQHNLTRFDICAGAKKEEEKPMNIIKNSNFRHHNTSPRPEKIEFIVVHYTASVADAAKQISYFNGSGATGASADFFVAWNGDVYQYNMEIKNRYSWAVGGGRQSQSGGAYYGRCLNRNQISIEMCCKSKTGAYVGANNSAWYFTDATVKATAQLVRELMDTYSIDPAHVIRHYDVNGKYCPGIKGWNAPSGSEEEWKKFKALISTETPEEKTEQEPAKVEQEEEKAEPKTGSTPYLVRVTIKTLRIRKGPGTGYPWSRYIAPGIYTIVEERYGEGSKAGWGRLKSGTGWISLDYARRV